VAGRGQRSRTAATSWLAAVVTLVVLAAVAPAALAAVSGWLRPGETVLVSPPLRYGDQVPSYLPQVSADGRIVAFLTTKPNNVGLLAIFDLKTRRLVRSTSRNAGALLGLSADGRYALYEEYKARPGLYRYDRLTRTRRPVDVSARGATPDKAAHPSGETVSRQLSGSGRYAVFTSSATNLLATPVATRGVVLHAYMKDLVSGAVKLLDSADDGTSPSSDGVASVAAVSANGRYAAFLTSGETPLELVDTRSGAKRFLRTPTPVSGACDCTLLLSADGSRVAFTWTSGHNRSLYVADVRRETSKPVITVSADDSGWIASADLSPDGAYASACTRPPGGIDKPVTLTVVDVDSGRTVKRILLGVHADYPGGALSSGGRVVVYASARHLAPHAGDDENVFATGLR
jgi:Tol biopolymer transport system component